MNNIEQMTHKLLGGMEERMKARMAKFEENVDDYRKRRMTMLDAHHKSIMACLGHTYPEIMQSVEEHQEVPRKEGYPAMQQWHG
jgi:hypothetical protein